MRSEFIYSQVSYINSQMSSPTEDQESPDKSIRGTETEHYDRVNATLRDSSILIAGCGILFGFLLDIKINIPPSFTLLDNIFLLISLYAVTVATALFILPVIYHQTHYHKFNIERFLFTSKKFLLRGTICLMITLYFGLGLALDSSLPTPVAYVLAFFPFIFIIRYLIEEIS